MIRWLLRAELRRFGRRYGYDVGYLMEMVAVDAAAGLRYVLATPLLQYRFGLPADVYFAAKIRAVGNADCGTCLELAIRMAQEAGVAPASIAAALGEDAEQGDVGLAVRYADAVAERSGDLPDLADAAHRRFGPRGVAGLATAIAAGQFYPTMKRGMGYGQSCSTVRSQWLARFRADAVSRARETA